MVVQFHCWAQSNQAPSWDAEAARSSDSSSQSSPPWELEHYSLSAQLELGTTHQKNLAGLNVIYE